jgi:hypothetical protein
MRARGGSVPAILTAISIVILGCGDRDCPRSLTIEVSYAGARSGVAYTRDLFLPTGTVLGFTGGGPPVKGPLGGVATSKGCWDSVAVADEAGFALEAWIDTDGDDLDPCRESPADRMKCAPDPGEPQVVQDYAVAAKGNTSVSVVIED